MRTNSDADLRLEAPHDLSLMPDVRTVVQGRRVTPTDTHEPNVRRKSHVVPHQRAKSPHPTTAPLTGRPCSACLHAEGPRRFRRNTSPPLQSKVKFKDKIVLPLGPHLHIVQKADTKAVTMCDCGHDFGDYREN